jgi:hypothetical protein
LWRPCGKITRIERIVDEGRFPESLLETQARGRLPEALSAYERLCATYPGEEAKGRMALLLRRTGAEQRAGAIFAEIRKSVERGPAFYRRAQREWYEIALRHA